MTGATQRPWVVIQDQYGNAGIADSVGDWIVEQVESVEYADLIVQAVNNHDALVEALEAVVEASNNAVRAGQAIGRSYTTPPVIQLVEAALKAVKS